MGCTGSKEAKPTSAATATAVDDDKPIPIRPVRTNFSDINYTDSATGRRDTTYAPSEIPESRRPTDAGPASPGQTAAPGETVTGESGLTVPPVGADGMLSPKSTSIAAVNGTTSSGTAGEPFPQPIGTGMLAPQ